MKRVLPLSSQLQRGMTLISLMAGTALSLLVMVAMLQLFKSVVRLTQDAQQDAVADGQGATALMTAGWAAQSAGFGVASAKEPGDLLLLREATFQNNQLAGTTTAIGAALTAAPGKGVAWVWRSKANASDTHTQCQALWAPVPPAQSAAAGTAGLYLLGPLTPCPASLLNVQWPKVQTLAASGTFSLSSTWAACHPMGQAVAATSTTYYAAMQIAAPNRAGVVLNEYWCLRNFSKPL